MVRSRVLVVPVLGYNTDYAASKLASLVDHCEPNFVHVLVMQSSLDENPEARERALKVLKELKEKRRPRLEWKVHAADFLRLESMLAKFAEIFALEEGKEVIVGLGAAGAAGAVPSTVACLLWKKEGVYPRDASRGKETDLVTTAFPDWLKMQSPFDDELLLPALAAMVDLVGRLDAGQPDAELDRAGARNGERDDHLQGTVGKARLILEFGRIGLLRVDVGPDDRVPKQLYRRLNERYLDRLTELGFVEEDKSDVDGRRYRVRPTENGIVACHVFRPMMPKVPKRVSVRATPVTQKDKRLDRFDGPRKAS